jgi:hypothetical protein
VTSWNHVTCDLLCLASFAQHSVLEVHLHCSVCQFLLLFNERIILLCTFVYMFIQCCFQFLAFHQSAAVNVCVYIHALTLSNLIFFGAGDWIQCLMCCIIELFISQLQHYFMNCDLRNGR